MKKNILIIIMIFFIAILCGYIAYDNLVLDKDNNVVDKGNDDINSDGEVYNENDEIDLTLKKDGVVVDAIRSSHKIFSSVGGNCIGDTAKTYFSVILPKLSGESDNILKFNKKIIKENENQIDFFESYSENDYSMELTAGCSYSSNYEYSVKDSIVYINISRNIACNCSGSGLGYFTYYFDLKNDKELTKEEVLKLNKIDEKVLNSYHERFGSTSDSYYEIAGLLPVGKNEYNIYYASPPLGDEITRIKVENGKTIIIEANNN